MKESGNQLVEYPVGDFCWVELVTSNARKALSFYSEIFGYKVASESIEGGSSYHRLSTSHGALVSGLYEDRDTSARWIPYIKVADIERSLKLLDKLGGIVEQAPVEVGDLGWLAECVDPTGAPFSLWQARSHVGSLASRESPGMYAWMELASPDLQASTLFYSKLCGWRMSSERSSSYAVMSLNAGGPEIAGILGLGEEFADAPSRWLPYFRVKDCAAIQRPITNAGGKVLHPPTEVAGLGTFLVFQDPLGAVAGAISKA